jgi:hypothetical protein
MPPLCNRPSPALTTSAPATHLQHHPQSALRPGLYQLCRLGPHPLAQRHVLELAARPVAQILAQPVRVIAFVCAELGWWC